MDSDKKIVGSWWIWITILLVFSMVTFGVLKGFGIIGSTVVENIVFKQSFQYKEGMEQRANILEANIAEINMLIATGSGDIKKLNAQKSILRVQLNSIRK